jgi:hypothetical protein
MNNNLVRGTFLFLSLASMQAGAMPEGRGDSSFLNYMLMAGGKGVDQVKYLRGVIKELEEKDSLTEAEQETLKNAKTRLDDFMSGKATIEQAILRGFAGERGYLIFRDMPLAGIGKSTLAGVLVRFLMAAGDQLEVSCNEHLGKATRSLFGFIGSTVQKVDNWLFHGGVAPYSVRQLKFMREQIMTVVLDGITERAKLGLQQQCDGLNSNSRLPFNYFDGDEGKADEQQTKENEEFDATWNACVMRYSVDFDRIVNRLEKHKAYYAPSSDDDFAFEVDGRADILAQVEQLQSTLAFMKEYFLLQSPKLNALALNDVKQMVEHTVNELHHRFELLTATVADYHNELLEKRGGQKMPQAQRSRISSDFPTE